MAGRDLHLASLYRYWDSFVQALCKHPPDPFVCTRKATFQPPVGLASDMFNIVFYLTKSSRLQGFKDLRRYFCWLACVIYIYSIFTPTAAIISFPVQMRGEIPGHEPPAAMLHPMGSRPCCGMACHGCR